METRQATTTSFIPLKKRFYIPSSPPSSDDEGDESSALPEPTFAPPPPYKQQAVVEGEVRLVVDAEKRYGEVGLTSFPAYFMGWGLL